MQRALGFLSVILLTAAFSGCLADGESTAHEHEAGDEHGEGDHGNHTANATSNATTPEIVVTISVNGTEVAALNGSFPVPAGQNVTFDASASTDPAGGNLTFMWDFGDNGTSEDAVATHTFAAAGNYTVELMAHGAEQMSTESFAMLVASAGPAAGAALADDVQKFEGTITLGVYGPDLGCGFGQGGVKEHEWVIAPTDAATGANVAVASFSLSMSGSASNVDSDLNLVGPDGEVIATGAPVESTDETIAIEGPFPAGTYIVRITGCTAVEGDYTVDAVAARVAA